MWNMERLGSDIRAELSRFAAERAAYARFSQYSIISCGVCTPL